MLIVGCGDVGTRVALAARARGESVECIVHCAQSRERLVAVGLTGMTADLDQSTSLPPELSAQDRIFYFAPPPPTGRSDPRMQHFLAALAPNRMRRIVYISTTGVYGDCGGEWVDETRPPNPQVDRAFRRHDAEQQLQTWRTAGGSELVILRVAGIYGPGKLPLERLQRQTPMVAAEEAPWTNRIHIDDLVQVCEAAMERAPDGAVYNVSDGQPGNMRDYFDRVADLFDLPRAPLVRLAEADGRLSAGLLSYLGESRRLDNRRMLDELGVNLRYPTLTDGLAACAAEQTPVSAGQ